MHSDPAVSVIIAVTLLYFFGLVGRFIAKWLHQPGVLGELLMGVLLGNVCYAAGLKLAVVLREGAAVYDIAQHLLLGQSLQEAVTSSVSKIDAASVLTALTGHEGLSFLKIAYVTDILSRYGVIFLLFMVGLESSIKELRKTGKESLSVACIGVLAPIVFGYLAITALLPQASFKTSLFVAATLCATSAGITARVFKDLHMTKTREARTILGAAMIDDVLGLMILAVVSSIVMSGTIEFLQITGILLYSLAFFTGAIWVGPFLLKTAIRFFRFLEPWETKLVVSFLFMMCLASLAACAHLATIIGAFVAGLLINDEYFLSHESRLTIHNLVAPIEALLAPLFFILIGIQVKLELFFHLDVILLALGLIVAAILGKLVSGIGANRKDDKWLVGVGMLPRGEVGLVFASIGKTLGVIPDEVFSAIIFMVIVTTLLAPPWLKARYQKQLSLTSE